MPTDASDVKIIAVVTDSGIDVLTDMNVNGFLAVVNTTLEFALPTP